MYKSIWACVCLLFLLIIKIVHPSCKNYLYRENVKNKSKILSWLHNSEIATISTFDSFLCLFLINVIPTCRIMLYTELSMLLIRLDFFFLCIFYSQIYSLNPWFNFLQHQLWYLMSPMLILTSPLYFLISWHFYSFWEALFESQPMSDFIQNYKFSKRPCNLIYFQNNSFNILLHLLVLNLFFFKKSLLFFCYSPPFSP